MRKLALLGGLFFLSAVSMKSASADDVFRYNFLQGAYQSVKVDELGFSDKVTASTSAVTGSYALNDMIALQAVAGAVSESFSPPGYNLDASGTMMGLGAALHKNITDNFEIGVDLGRIGLDLNKYTINGIDQPTYKSYTSSADFKVRAAITPEFLLGASVGHGISESKTGSGPGYAFNAMYYPGKSFGLGAAYSISHSISGYTRGFTIGARYFF